MMMDRTRRRQSALLSLAVALACTIETELPRGIEADDPYRDGGDCGSNRSLGTGRRTCTYTAKKTHDADTLRFKAIGTCVDKSHIKCVYDGSKTQEPVKPWCYWDSTSSVEGCAAPLPGQAAYPSCDDYPAVDGAEVAHGGITFPAQSITVELPITPDGSQLCVAPPNPYPSYPNDFDRYCIDNITPETKKQLDALCTGIASVATEGRIDCCISTPGQPCGGSDEDTGGTTECLDASTSSDASSSDAPSPDPMPAPSPG
jgi:hypothetical protein